jgi:hypothetical protein
MVVMLLFVLGLGVSFLMWKLAASAFRGIK